MFAEESVLVAQNWEIVEDIEKAIEKLQQDLTKLLLSVEHDLVLKSWWADGWSFVLEEDEQIYISNRRWKPDHIDNYAIWLGVEKVSPGHLFGLDSAPQCYLWISNRKNWPGLSAVLSQELALPKYELLHNLDTRPTNGYIVRGPVKKYRPGEDIEAYSLTLKQDIIEFFSYYAPILLDLDPIIQKHLNKG